MKKKCSVCQSDSKVITQLQDFTDQPLVETIRVDFPDWQPEQGICLSCLDSYHQQILINLMNVGQQKGYTVLPTPIRLNAHPDFNGKGITICLIDSGFFYHPDLSTPKNRIKKILDITQPNRQLDYFKKPHDNAWHGTMTSVVCAGNGSLSQGVYKGVAPAADLVLLKVMDEEHRISEANIVKALDWVKNNYKKYKIKIVNLSISGDEEVSYQESEINQLIKDLFNLGITVVAAVGNDPSAPILPPANSLEVIAVGGLDDRNSLDPLQQGLYHSNYGYTVDGLTKPELIAPAIWLAAPILPETNAAKNAKLLFDKLLDTEEETDVLDQIKKKKLISSHYQYADGTSFAAPIVCAVIAQMLEANPSLSPMMIREILFSTARAIPSTEKLRQGYGVLQAGQAVSQSSKETNHKWITTSPIIDYRNDKIIFKFHDHKATQIYLTGNFNDWNPNSLPLKLEKEGYWRIEIPLLSQGIYQYKFIVNNDKWVSDPLNYFRHPDGYNDFNSRFFIK